MKWRKSPDALVQAFDHSLPIVDGVDRRAMFGYPCAFFGGHLFCGLHQDSIIVLLPEARRDALVAEGASVFEPMSGGPMHEYVVVPPEIAADRQRLRALLSDALAHASSLTPKAKTPPAKAAPAKRTTAVRKAPARKAASAKRVVARRAPDRKAAPAKKAPAKKAPAKKASAKKAAAKKAARKK